MSDTNETPEAAMVQVHLFGGAQDGFKRKIELRSTAPSRFYVWPPNDGQRIEDAKGRERIVLQTTLAILAYEMFDEVDVENGSETLTEYRYRRHESADKKPQVTEGA